MADDEAAELRAVLGDNGLSAVAVPDDWPALPEPEEDESLRAYVQRAIVLHPVVSALSHNAGNDGRSGPSVTTVHPAKFTRERIGKPDSAAGEPLGARLAGASERRPRVIYSSYMDNAPEPRRVAEPRVRVVVAADAARRLSVWAFRRLALVMLDTLRAGDWELWGMEVGRPAPALVPRQWLGDRGMVLACGQEHLRPASEKDAGGLPHYSSLTLRRRPPARPAQTVAPPPPIAAAEPEAPDPLLFRYGLPLSRALRHLADPEMWLAAAHPEPSPEQLLRALRTLQTGRPPAPHVWWSAEAALASKVIAERRARTELTREHEAELIRRLWQRLADGGLVAWGRRGSVAEPYAAIEADIWRYLAPKHWDAGHVAGGGADFYGVRVFDPAGLPLELAAEAFAALPVVREYEALKAQGYPSAPLAFVVRTPEGYSAEDDARAARVWAQMAARLMRFLASGQLRAEGWAVGGRQDEGVKPIDRTRWRLGDGEGLYVLWDESTIRLSPDRRQVSDCDTDELHEIRDVRVHLPEARPLPAAAQPAAAAPKDTPESVPTPPSLPNATPPAAGWTLREAIELLCPQELALVEQGGAARTAWLHDRMDESGRLMLRRAELHGDSEHAWLALTELFEVFVSELLRRPALAVFGYDRAAVSASVHVPHERLVDPQLRIRLTGSELDIGQSLGKGLVTIESGQNETSLIGVRIVASGPVQHHGLGQPPHPAPQHDNAARPGEPAKRKPSLSYREKDQELAKEIEALRLSTGKQPMVIARGLIDRAEGGGMPKSKETRLYLAWRRLYGGAAAADFE